ncbi:hypothetical protein IV102_11080 [bacterium]|nr:hypothetical protein [bacterium]
MHIQSNQASKAARASKPSSRSGPEMSTHCSLNELKDQLRGLSETELQATSVVEYRGFGQNKEYAGFILVTDDARKPRCPNDPLPMNNQALKTMVNALTGHYGAKGGKRDLAFLNDGLPQPGYTQVTLSDSGLGLYFETATGKPMGKLTGSL